MTALLLATLLSLPLYPVNPIKQDTVALLNAHFTMGFSAPNGITNAGLEGTSKWELMVVHPIVVRGGIDYRVGNIRARRYPAGVLHGSTLSAEVLAYRGTNRLTGFIGGGVVLGKYFVDLDGAAADSLKRHHDIDGVSVEPSLGYRFTMGLRLRSHASIEVSVTSITTDFLFRQSLGPDRYRQWREPLRLRDFRVSVGYLLPIVDLN